MIKVYGVPGWGSTISELMLTLADIPYQFVDVSGFDHEGASRELLKTLNPLCQVPTLALENDEIMRRQRRLHLWFSIVARTLRHRLGAPNVSSFNGYWSGWLLMSIQHSLSPITLSVGHLTHLNS